MPSDYFNSKRDRMFNRHMRSEEEMMPDEDKALLHVADKSTSKEDFDHLVEVLGLEGAVERAERKQPVNR